MSETDSIDIQTHIYREIIKLNDRIKKLEAWQKEAVEELRAISSMLNLMNYHPTGAISARIKTAIRLIKQSEDNQCTS